MLSFAGYATTYGYDQAGNLISVERPKEDEIAEIKDTYAYGGNGLRVSQTISGTATYLTWDMTEGLPLILGDGTNSYIYGPGGLPVEQTGSTGTSTTPLGYDGQYTSSDTGLIYLRARVYDPATAQFLTADPAALQTRAPYNYVGDNPCKHKPLNARSHRSSRGQGRPAGPPHRGRGP